MSDEAPTTGANTPSAPSETVAVTSSVSSMSVNAAPNEDNKSELILGMQKTIQEQQEKIAEFEALKALEHSRDKDKVIKHMEDTNEFFHRVTAATEEHERESFLEECAKAKTFLNSVPNMNPLDMARHAPLVAVTCKASKALAKIDTLEKNASEQQTQLKRALEQNEKLEEQCEKMRRENTLAVQLAEARQAALEEALKEKEEIKTRAINNDFSSPVANREYLKTLEELRKYQQGVASKQQPQAADPHAPATEVTSNGKAPMVMNTGHDLKDMKVEGMSGMMTTTLSASAGGGASSSSSNPAPQAHNSMQAHVNYLSDLILSRSTPTTTIHLGAGRGSMNPDVTMTDAERVMAALR